MTSGQRIHRIDGLYDYPFEQKNKTDKKKVQLTKVVPNRTAISVTEMVVCHKDRWVNRDKLAIK